MKIKREMIGIIAWLLISLFVMISSWNLGLGQLENPGPGFFPFWSSLLLGLLALLMMGNIYYKKEEDLSEPGESSWKDYNWHKIIVIIAALFAYCLVLPRLGYLMSTMALMLILFYVGRMKPWALIAGSMLAVLLSYCVFLYGLKTPLPRGIWGF